MGEITQGANTEGNLYLGEGRRRRAIIKGQGIGKKEKKGKANLSAPKVGQGPGWMLYLINLFYPHINPTK